jgi:hypothetical protein
MSEVAVGGLYDRVYGSERLRRELGTEPAHLG